MRKKLLLIVVVAFLGFWIYTEPAAAADTLSGAASGLWDGTQQGFSAVIDFIGELG